MKIRIHHKTLPRHQNVITKPYPLAAHDMRFCRDTEMITELQGRTTIHTDTRAMSDSSSSLENHRAIHLPHRTRPFLVKDTDTAKQKYNDLGTLNAYRHNFLSCLILRQKLLCSALL